jgi:hypothetical protein
LWPFGRHFCLFFLVKRKWDWEWALKILGFATTHSGTTTGPGSPTTLTLPLGKAWNITTCYAHIHLIVQLHSIHMYVHTYIFDKFLKIVFANNGWILLISISEVLCLT